MPEIDYSRNTKLAAQTMRSNMTEAESKLWYGFLRKFSLPFRRQKQFGRFIVDFYCSKAKLVVEVDGNQHYTDQGKAYDQERTWYLNSLGLDVIRFSNDEVMNHFQSVCFAISKYCA